MIIAEKSEIFPGSIEETHSFQSIILCLLTVGFSLTDADKRKVRNYVTSLQVPDVAVGNIIQLMTSQPEDIDLQLEICESQSTTPKNMVSYIEVRMRPTAPIFTNYFEQT